LAGASAQNAVPCLLKLVNRIPAGTVLIEKTPEICRTVPAIAAYCCSNAHGKKLFRAGNIIFTVSVDINKTRTKYSALRVNCFNSRGQGLAAGIYPVNFRALNSNRAVEIRAA
jgi:hypothetical protein